MEPDDFLNNKNNQPTAAATPLSSAENITAPNY